MKKIVLISIIAVLVISGCANKKSEAKPAAEITEEDIFTIPDGIDVVIRERLFIGQVNDVYRNPDEYVGKTIKLEGLFMYGIAGDREYCYVIRKGPGCCGDDGQVGFEVSWNPPGDPPGERDVYPKSNAWVAAQGELKRYESQGYNFLYLSLSELNTLEKRGKEFVLQ